MNFLRHILLKIAYPFLRFMEVAGKPEPKVPAAYWHSIEHVAQAGDVLLSRENWRSTNLIIPGFWAHAAIYAGNGVVIEAIGLGVQAVPFVKWVLGKDHAALLRFKNVPPEKRTLAGMYAFGQIGRPYDYDFASGTQAWYCAELVWYSHECVLRPDNPFTLRKTWGVDTVTPDDFYRSDKLELLAKFGGPQ